MDAARAKMAAAFEFIAKLGVPFFCFHDRDMAPEGRTFAESRRNLETLVDEAGERMAQTGIRLPLGDSQPVLASPVRGGRGHQPRSRGLRLCGGAGQS